MDWSKNNKEKKMTWSFSRLRTVGAFLLLVCISIAFNSCSISYKFDGGSINYDLTKTIRIDDFPNRTAYNPELAYTFNQALRRRFIEQTRLVEVDGNADIEISGEITGYDFAGMAVKDDAYASRTRLTITVKLEYINNKEANKDVEQTFSSFQELDSDNLDDSAVSSVVTEIVDNLVDMIYNATVANW